MAAARDRRARALALKKRGLKLFLLSLVTFGIGGWFAIKKPLMGVLVIVLQAISIPLVMFLGIGILFFIIVWFGSCIYMGIYPKLSRVGAVFDQIEDQADYREHLEGGGVGSV